MTRVELQGHKQNVYSNDCVEKAHVNICYILVNYAVVILFECTYISQDYFSGNKHY
jgi:hypothetical protein